jgi:hypothetical protein
MATIVVLMSGTTNVIFFHSMLGVNMWFFSLHFLPQVFFLNLVLFLSTIQGLGFN